jgi:hypothetical protein
MRNITVIFMANRFRQSCFYVLLLSICLFHLTITANSAEKESTAQAAILDALKKYTDMPQTVKTGHVLKLLHSQIP